ncbi:zinc-ribbon domain-containing protein [Mycobacterium sp.]|uniref:zinc-ribbon domain-containing protein n=1 Tax=Mycobacterium sp. TaxID=1785 RepID=UPI0039C9BB21
MPRSARIDVARLAQRGGRASLWFMAGESGSPAHGSAAQSRIGQSESCPACGLALRDGARFCDGCGAPVTAPTRTPSTAGDGAVRRCGSR